MERDLMENIFQDVLFQIEKMTTSDPKHPYVDVSNEKDYKHKPITIRIRNYTRNNNNLVSVINDIGTLNITNVVTKKGVKQQTRGFWC